MKKILWVILIVVLIFIGLSRTAHLPSNEKLIEEFQQNKEIFERLRNMYLEDLNLYVLGKYNDGERYVKYYDDEKSRLSEIREKEYFELLEKINVAGTGHWGLIKGDEKNEIFFNVARSGWAGGGTVKRLVWLKEKPKQLQAKYGTATITLFPIEDDWYLCEEYYP